MTDLVADIQSAVQASMVWKQVPRLAVNDYLKFYGCLPKLFADRLQTRVTLQEVINSQLIWVRFLIEQQAPRKVAEAMSYSDPGETEALGLFAYNAKRNEDKLRDRERFLGLFENRKSIFVPEKETRLTLFLWGLEGEALKEYDRGTLTIECALRLVPFLLAPLVFP